MLPLLLLTTMNPTRRIIADATTPAMTATIVPTSATAGPTETPTAIVTETATETIAVTAEVTSEVTETATSTPVIETSPTPEATEVIDEITISEPEDEMMSAQAAYACQLDINDAGDANPFTFNFAAINAQNIASYTWDFGDT